MKTGLLYEWKLAGDFCNIFTEFMYFKVKSYLKSVKFYVIISILLVFPIRLKSASFKRCFFLIAF